MFAMIKGFFTGGWGVLIPWALGALALAGAYIYVHHQSATIASLQANLAQAHANTLTAETAAKSNAAALADAQRQHQDDLAALTVHYDGLARLEHSKDAILEKVNHAPESDDGPVSPILRRTLDSLREQAGSHHGATDASGAAQAPGSAAGVPGKP